MSSIRKLHGKWIAQVNKTGHPRVSKYFTSKSLAVQWANSIEHKYEQVDAHGYDKSLKTHKLYELLDRYEETKSRFKRSYDKEVYFLKMWRYTPLAQKRVGDITVSMVASYKDKWLSHVKPSTIRNRFALLRHLFNVAIDEWGYPITNPVSKIKMPKSADTPIRRIRDEHLKELDKIFREKQSVMRWVVIFGLETAMRRGELVNLKWEDIDRTRNTARISESKAGRVRFVPLTPKAIECLESIPSQSEYVFNTTTSAIASAWKRIRVKAGFKEIRFHDIRHEAISRFFEKGLTIPEVASISGHSTPQMLFRYAHADQSKIAEKLAS